MTEQRKRDRITRRAALRRLHLGADGLRFHRLRSQAVHQATRETAVGGVVSDRGIRERGYDSGQAPAAGRAGGGRAGRNVGAGPAPIPIKGQRRKRRSRNTPNAEK